MDWLMFAILSAFFAGITSILAKIGIRDIDSTVVTALRTVVVTVFAWLMVFLIGSQSGISGISFNTFLFLFLSGLTTGASWLCYFKALEKGNVNKVVPIDKSSIVITVILAVLILGEGLSPWGAAGIVFIAIGTMAMIEKKDTEKVAGGPWLLYAIGSAVFAALTSIFGKVGIEGVESTLGTAIRTLVVLAMSWMMVYVVGKQDEIRGIPRKAMGFVIASGLATGASWLCFYRALQTGPASVVVPIDKLSILVAVVFAFFLFGERLNRRALAGLILIVAGTLMMLY